MCLCRVVGGEAVEAGGGDRGVPHCRDRQRGGGGGWASPGGRVRPVLNIKGGGGEGFGTESGAGLQVERLLLN